MTNNTEQQKEERFLSYALRNGLSSVYTGVLIKDYVLKYKNSCAYGKIYKKIREDRHLHKQTDIYYIVVYLQEPIQENLLFYKRTTSLKLLNQIIKRWNEIKI